MQIKYSTFRCVVLRKADYMGDHQKRLVEWRTSKDLLLLSLQHLLDPQKNSDELQIFDIFWALEEENYDEKQILW